jgi:hypothetical protein
MRRISGLLPVLVGMVVHAPIVAADLESRPLQPPNYSLTELQPPENRDYIPSWANLYGRMPDLGINDDTNPFDDGDVNSGRSPLDSDDY